MESLIKIQEQYNKVPIIRMNPYASKPEQHAIIKLRSTFQKKTELFKLFEEKREQILEQLMQEMKSLSIEQFKNTSEMIDRFTFINDEMEKVENAKI